jgi:hypothetical protein
LMIALLSAEALLIWNVACNPWIGVALTTGALFFLADALLIWRDHPYASWQMRLFFVGWNAAALVSIPWVWRTASFAARR